MNLNDIQRIADAVTGGPDCDAKDCPEYTCRGTYNCCGDVTCDTFTCRKYNGREPPACDSFACRTHKEKC